jgi:chromosome segregation ATPase
LKKKTQELEKFKFVLDYKIKELKRDINPKEAEIAKLNEQTTKMDQELKHFQRVNENLALIVDDLKMRQEGLQEEVKGQNGTIEQQQSYIKKFNDDLYDCMNNIDKKKALKNDIINLHKKYVLEEVRTNRGEADIQKQYAAERKYLEKSVNYLRIMIAKDSNNHKQEYTRYMKENVTLLQEINDLRKEVKTLDSMYKLQRIKQGSTMGSRFSAQDEMEGTKMQVGGDQAKELDLQEQLIQQYSDELARLEEENATLNNRARSSRGARNLPPINRQEEQKQPEPEGEDDPRQKESEKRLDDFKDDEEEMRAAAQNQEENEPNEEEQENEAEDN